ncbi:TPA: hypothetical protein U0K44_002018 [Streptococcus suis]|nr:hypothetical protein [Streptococcus suis]
MSATSIAGGFLIFLYEKNWLEAIIEKMVPEKQATIFLLHDKTFARQDEHM